MHWWGSGLITILSYLTTASAAIESTDILTEANDEILTEGSNPIIEE